MGKQTVCMACLLSKGFIIFYGVFGKVDFREEKTKERKYEERKFFGGCLVRRESEIFCGGAQVFSS